MVSSKKIKICDCEFSIQDFRDTDHKWTRAGINQSMYHDDSNQIVLMKKKKIA
jgi:hypothetical protein